MTGVHRDLVFLMSCPDAQGILAAVAEAIAAAGGDIRDAASFGDADGGQFFIRIHLHLPAAGSYAALEAALGGVAARLSGDWQLRDLDARARVMIAVSKFDHCLTDLLARWKKGQLPGDIRLIVSNHDDVRDIADWHGIEFHHLPVSANTKAAQETALRELADAHDIELIVLARYMQILSPALVAHWRGRCINIHHSFLPSFKGARPYAQAHARGVKLIGATAHYVTDDLDEGPIIEQDVRRVSHATSADEMASLGREIESSVLGRAVRWHLQHRVLFNGRKTVVFAH